MLKDTGGRRFNDQLPLPMYKLSVGTDHVAGGREGADPDQA